MPAFTKRQLDRFLRKPLIARIATLLNDGMPTITPVWFEWNPKSRSFLLWARKGYGGLSSGWYVNLTRDPRIALLVDESSETPPKHDRVLAIGKARILLAPKNSYHMRIRMSKRYIGSDKARRYLATMPEASGGWVRMLPDRIVSWTEGKGTNVWHSRYLEPGGRPLFEPNPQETCY